MKTLKAQTRACSIGPFLAPDPFLAVRLVSPSVDAAAFTLVQFASFLHESPWSDVLSFWFLRRPKGGANLEIFVHSRWGCAFTGRDKIRNALLGFCREYLLQIEERQFVSETSLSEKNLVFEMTYQRDPIVLAGKPFIQNDEYISVFLECLSRSAMLLLDEIAKGAVLLRSRQTLFLRFLVAGLSVCRFDLRTRSQYFKYHRDWVLRFPFWRTKKAVYEFREAARRRIGCYEEHIETHHEQLVPCFLIVRSLMEEDSEKNRRLEYPLLAWQSAFRSVYQMLEELCQHADFYRDPYAGEPIFSMIFKIFNMIANQLGLKQDEEAFVAHLLFRSLAGDKGDQDLAY